MRLNKLSILTTLAILAFLAVPKVAHAQLMTTNDGIYRIHLTADAASVQTGAKDFDEAFIFEGSTMQMEIFSKMGFDKATCAFDLVTNTFTVTMVSTNRGTLAWQYKFVNNTCVGTLVWTREVGDARVWKFAITPLP